MYIPCQKYDNHTNFPSMESPCMISFVFTKAQEDAGICFYKSH